MYYKIIKSDLFINGNLFPEGDVISLDAIPDDSIISFLELVSERDSDLPEDKKDFTYTLNAGRRQFIVTPSVTEDGYMDVSKSFHGPHLIETDPLQTKDIIKSIKEKKKSKKKLIN